MSEDDCTGEPREPSDATIRKALLASVEQSDFLREPPGGVVSVGEPRLPEGMVTDDRGDEWVVELEQGHLTETAAISAAHFFVDAILNRGRAEVLAAVEAMLRNGYPYPETPIAYFLRIIAKADFPGGDALSKALAAAKEEGRRLASREMAATAARAGLVETTGDGKEWPKGHSRYIDVDHEDAEEERCDAWKFVAIHTAAATAALEQRVAELERECRIVRRANGELSGRTTGALDGGEATKAASSAGDARVGPPIDTVVALAEAEHWRTLAKELQESERIHIQAGVNACNALRTERDAAITKLNEALADRQAAGANAKQWKRERDAAIARAEEAEALLRESIDAMGALRNHVYQRAVSNERAIDELLTNIRRALGTEGGGE